MPFVYVQKTGTLYGPNRKIITHGYSGHGDGYDNPAMEAVKATGPIPTGRYTIGDPRDPIDHLGPLAMPLIPDSKNEMHGRSGFFIHGDNAKANRSASDGCIILGRPVRTQIRDSYEQHLVVVAQEADVAAAYGEPT